MWLMATQMAMGYLYEYGQPMAAEGGGRGVPTAVPRTETTWIIRRFSLRCCLNNEIR